MLVYMVMLGLRNENAAAPLSQKKSMALKPILPLNLAPFDIAVQCAHRENNVSTKDVVQRNDFRDLVVQSLEDDAKLFSAGQIRFELRERSIHVPSKRRPYRRSLRTASGISLLYGLRLASPSIGPEVWPGAIMTMMAIWTL